MDTLARPARGAAKKDSSLIAFYARTSEPERSTVWAYGAGWALDGMGFMIYRV